MITHYLETEWKKNYNETTITQPKWTRPWLGLTHTTRDHRQQHQIKYIHTMSKRKKYEVEEPTSP